MNIILRAAYIVLCGTLAAASCAMDTPSPTELKLTQADHNRAINVEVGTTVDIELQGVPGTGYSWQLQPLSNDVLQYIGTKAIPSEAAPGAAQMTQLLFRAVRPGEAVLQLHYARPWEKAKPPLREFSVKVRVNQAKG